jgi:hypothetical protein
MNSNRGVSYSNDYETSGRQIGIAPVRDAPLFRLISRGNGADLISLRFMYDYHLTDGVGHVAQMFYNLL